MKLSFTLLLFTQVAGVAANEEEFSHRKLRGLLGFNKNVVVSFKEECDDIEGDVSKAGADRLLDFISLKLKTAVLRPMAASLLKKLVDSDCVESFEEEEEFEVASLPAATTQPGAPWHLDRIDNGVDGNYEYELTGNGVDAYLLSTGINELHEDFGGRAECVYVPVPFERSCEDRFGAGTAEMAVLGGSLYGVAKEANLKMIKVVTRRGRTRTGILLRGLNYIVDQRVETGRPMVVSLGLSGRFRDDALEKAINRLVEEYGVPVVVAAGNGGGDACRRAPASAEAALTVGSTTDDDTVAADSNTGECVDLYAPGVGLDTAGTTDVAATVSYQGTGMASALAAGVAALYLERNPGLNGRSIFRSMKMHGLSGVLTGASPNVLLNTAGAYIEEEGTMAPTGAVPTTTPGVETTSPTPSPADGPDPVTDFPLRINCGGDEITVASGVWLADQFFVNGELSRPLARDNYGRTEDHFLFKTDRWDPALKYEIPLETGFYEVTTYYAETFFEGPDLREFDIYAEGILYVENVDIFEDSTRMFRVLTHTFTVGVNDGILDLELIGSIENGKLNALQVIKV